MNLPFTVEQFFGVFRSYNEALWPAQVLLLAVALAAIGLVVFPRRWSGVGVSAILAFLVPPYPRSALKGVMPISTASGFQATCGWINVRYFASCG